VKYTQRTFMTPLPHVASFEALNAALAERCRARQGEHAGQHAETIGERLVRDLGVLSGIPEGRFEPCEKKPAKVSSTGLARYRMNDYSVLTRFAFQNVVKGFVDEVVIVAGSEIIARHGRIYGRDQFVSIPSTTWRCWSRSPARWTRPRHCRQATCAGPHRAASGPAGSDPVSLSSGGPGEDHGGDRLCRPAVAERYVTAAPPLVLLAHHLKTLKLPTFLREYEKVAGECAREGADHPRYRLRLAELELIDRERRLVERRIHAAHFPAVKSLDTFDFTAMPGLNKPLALELARCEFVVARDNIIVLGNSGTGKTHMALALGLAACQSGFSVSFVTTAALVHQLQEARDECRLLRLQQNLAAAKLLIVDELGYVPLSQTGAELLFEVFSQRHERNSTIVTSNPAVRGMDFGVRLAEYDWMPH
jgi:DNA replication protein DnaC